METKAETKTCTRCRKNYEEKNLCPACYAGDSVKKAAMWKWIFLAGLIILSVLLSWLMN